MVQRGSISQSSHQLTIRLEYDYHVILHADRNKPSTKLPLESYGTEADAAVGSWVLLEVDDEEGVRKSKRATTLNVLRTELSAE